ncbi:cilia- and flagella-associated protein 73-like [Diabrotica virgifera virgifera]|uniref:DUF4200 domain-containing protein n=1 Tax=Diabrotica virgifera virgifera TaxID=50390 RepID=A0ABM5IE61_DIAVI|nr:cilia- and flagella-associated protein 73-like [Diabrotica virgifera virgifera]
MQSESKLCEYETEAIIASSSPENLEHSPFQSSKLELKYPKEDYRKIFKQQNENRKSLRLLSNKVAPYTGCTDYLMSKKRTKKRQKKIDLENLAKRNVLTSHSLAQRRLYQIDDDLKQLREEEIERRKVLDNMWKELKNKEESLRDSFIGFDKFMIENKEKRERSTEKITTMGALAQEKTQQVEELRKEYDQCIELKELLDNGIKNHSHFEKYLLAVVDKNHKKFSTIEDLFKRFDALLEARYILSNLFERHLSQLEEAKDAVDKMVMVKCVKIAGLSNTLADLHKRFEAAKFTCANWEQYHHKVVLEAMEKVMEIQAVKDSVWQVYQDICRRKGVKPVFKGNYAQQLEIIKKALLKFRLVNKMAKAMQDESGSPRSEEASSSDSIVVNVVHKVNKKLEENAKIVKLPPKEEEKKVSFLQIPHTLLAAMKFKGGIKKAESGIHQSRSTSLMRLSASSGFKGRTSRSS